LIGEIRDLETMMAAIAYAQSGHLVVATLHANNSYQALNRIISFFPIENRSALLLDLASAIKAIISQRLIKAIDGGRCPAVEIMLNTRYVAELIEQGNIFQIKEAIEKSLAPGSQTFERALLQLIKDGLITQEEGLANADSANNLLWLLNNDTVLAQKAQAEPEPEHHSEATFTEFNLNM
jgi:twitching motility protein PilU